MTPFRQYDDVAVVEHDDATRKPLEGGRVIPAIIAAVNDVFTVIDREQPLLWAKYPTLYDTGSGWGAGSYRWRLVSLCHRCGEPVTGTPVTADEDPLHRQFCTGECRDAAAEASYEQRYQPGVAT